MATANGGDTGGTMRGQLTFDHSSARSQEYNKKPEVSPAALQVFGENSDVKSVIMLQMTFESFDFVKFLCFLTALCLRWGDGGQKMATIKWT